jgi:hypothetical protein
VLKVRERALAEHVVLVPRQAGELAVGERDFVLREAE